MTKAFISLPHLKAASFAAASDGTRYYLCGVSVTIDARGSAYVATDGRTLFACRHELPDGEPDSTLLGSWIVPTKFCDPFKLRKRDPGVFAILTSDSAEPAPRLTLTRDDNAVTFSPINGSFPDWRRALPSKVKPDCEGHTFDMRLLLTLEKAGRALGFTAFTWTPNGSGPAPVQYGDDKQAFGVIMPKSMKAAPFNRPSWA